MVHIPVQIITRAGPVRTRSLRVMVSRDEMEEMLIQNNLMECLGIDPHEILAARLEDGAPGY